MTLGWAVAEPVEGQLRGGFALKGDRTSGTFGQVSQVMTGTEFGARGFGFPDAPRAQPLDRSDGQSTIFLKLSDEGRDQLPDPGVVIRRFAF